ncbi:hypothetical protein WBP07_21575 (plasmid) [Novosphingobium sp. BL-8A]|uniref:DUF7079 family protein n=1 Tax=Novosphingobium sp. BL-8A TaxID=3127639 RepID=UPI0037581B01
MMDRRVAWVRRHWAPDAVDAAYRIADFLAASPYHNGELEGILVDEVLPAFAPNLLTVAGEWAPWSEDEVRGIMIKAGARGFVLRRIARLVARPVKKDVLEEWRRVLRVLELRRRAGLSER